MALATSKHRFRQTGWYSAGPWVLLLCLVSGAPILRAQSGQSGDIHGVVTDNTGAVIGDVAAILTGPALVVPRKTTTDASGQYHFEQVPIGAYTLTLNRAGFQQSIQNNIQITPAFSAEVNLHMAVGSVSESITVSAAGPVIDTTNTSVTTDLGPSTLADELPVTRTTQDIVATTPGTVPTAPPDLGGGTVAPASLSAYGTVGQETALLEGIDTRTSNTFQDSNFDATALEVYQVVATGGDAQVALPGVYVNAVVKQGGNTLHGRFEITGEDQKFESDNLTPLIRSQGTTVGQKILNATDFSGNMGGPLIKNRLWWFFGYHINRTNRNVVGYLLPNGQAGALYSRVQNFTSKATYQISPNYKLIGFYTEYQVYYPYYGASALVAQSNTRNLYGPANQWKGEIQGTPNSRLVLDFFAGHHGYLNYYRAQPDVSGIPFITDQQACRMGQIFCRTGVRARAGRSLIRWPTFPQAPS
jgi:hypothetical protein